MRLAKEAQQRQRELWYAEEEKALADMKANGVEVVEVADKEAFREAVKPVWDKHGAAARRADRAHPGGPVTNRTTDARRLAGRAAGRAQEETPGCRPATSPRWRRCTACACSWRACAWS